MVLFSKHYLDSILFDLRTCDYYGGILQNHRMPEASRHLWRSSHHPPTQARPAKAGWAGPHPDSFWTMQGHTTSLENLCQCPVTLTVNVFFNAKISLTFKQNIGVLFSLVLSWGTTYKQLGSVYFKPCLPISVHTYELLLHRNRQPQLRLSSQM